MAQTGHFTSPRRPEESMLASATVDAVPRVGIVLSSLRKAQDHDGTEFPGLSDPRPVDAELTTSQKAAMLRKAIEFGARNGRATLGRLGFPSDEWVVFLISLEPPGTDPDLLATLVEDFGRLKRGRRFTIAGAGAVTGTIASLVKRLTERYRPLCFEYVDLSRDAWLEAPAVQRTFATRNPRGTYAIARTIRECDRLITIGPLRTSELTGVALSADSFWAVTPIRREKLLALGDAVDVLTDLFAHHPPDYAILGGVTHADAQGAVRHNIVIAGSNAVAVDGVGAAVMGFEPSKVPLLDKLEARGFGVIDPGAIWTRGSEIEEARKSFARPKGFV